MRDWSIKKEALCQYFAVYTLSELVRCVYNESADLLKTMQDAIRKWDDNPQQVVRGAGGTFANALAIAITTEKVCAQQIRNSFLGGSYNDFYNSFPVDTRYKLPPPNNDLENEVASYFPIQMPLKTPYVDAFTTVKNGRVDQKYHYISHDSAKLWRNVVDSGVYRQYEECKSALEALCNEAIWREFFSKTSSDGIVSLGGGSPSKDIFLINNVLEIKLASSRINYALVDFSSFMLTDSMRLIEATLINQKKRVYVNLDCLCEDFLNLQYSSKLRRPGKNIAWIIPGGTLGNLDESRFFDSIAKVAESGDLLIVGVDTIVETTESAVANATKKYESTALNQLVGTPLRHIWHDLQINMSLDTAMSRVVKKPISGAENIYSEVDGAVTIEISIEIDSRKIVLATSTRYLGEKLIELAAAYGFSHKQTVASSLSPTFKAFAFKYDTGTS
jgi:Histidine-specific methyltransferase, SAM-dependent